MKQSNAVEITAPEQADRVPAGNLTRNLKALASRLDFALVGICPAVEPAGLSRFYEWLARGYAGEMHYLAARSNAYRHPQHVLDGVRSIVVLAMPYRTTEPQPARAGQGRISRYAWGGDYHDVTRNRLAQLCTFINDRAPRATCRGVVDTAPLLERELAQLAGLGWIGKNTLLLNRQLGSWFFLAALLTDIELEFDQPSASEHCGTCRACLDACPTGALVAPYVLDARRCISYLTIELRSPIPTDLRSGVGDWLYGCDICQDVCPWNTHAAYSTLPAFHASTNSNPANLAELFFMSEAEFRARYRDTPLWRPRRRGVLRNAAIVLGNQAPWPHELGGTIEQALICGLNDAEPLVRGASAWALGQGATACAANELDKRLAVEADGQVREEINGALTNIDRAALSPQNFLSRLKQGVAMTVRRRHKAGKFRAAATLLLGIFLGFMGGCTRQLDPKEFGNIVTNEAELPGAGNSYPLPELDTPAKKETPAGLPAVPEPGP